MDKRSKEILSDEWAAKNYCDVPRGYIDSAFLDGVDWADEHPNWNCIETDGLPEIKDGCSDFCIVAFGGSSDYVKLSYYDGTEKRWKNLTRIEEKNVTHWIQVPKLP